jgi:CubicO group peptidase (beta-lactamase class C family)
MDNRIGPTTGRLLAVILAVYTASAAALAQGLPVAAKPEDLGFSAERLDRITARFQEEVDGSKIPGAVIEIARDGKVAYLHAFGFQDRDKKIPMQIGALFRLASLSKPLTSVAAMMLAEEGKLDLAAPIAKYLPEFSNVRVGVERTDPTTGKHKLVMEPPKRPPTIQDLLRHTAGFIYGPAASQSLVSQAYVQADPLNWQETTAEMVTKVARLPLAAQPETAWEYSLATDVLGRVVEVASGLDLDRFIRERISDPLRLSGFRGKRQ